MNGEDSATDRQVDGQTDIRSVKEGRATTIV